METFPSQPFFQRLRRELARGAPRFAALGSFDATFGIRVLRSPGVPADRLFVLGFEIDQCTRMEEAPAGAQPAGLDFVLEAPLPVWTEMLRSRGPDGRIDARHGINTLSHFDHPMRVACADPDGLDKLYRFQASVQLVFDLAAAAEAEPGPE